MKRGTVIWVSLFVLFVILIASVPAVKAETLRINNIEKVFITDENTVTAIVNKGNGSYAPRTISLSGFILSAEMIIKIDVPAEKKPYIHATYDVDDTIWNSSKWERRLYHKIIIHVRSLDEISSGNFQGRSLK